jgi:uncharacterized protein (DUF3084 family)
MGKKTKEHRQKVAKRNARIQQEKNLMSKMYKDLMESKLKELSEKVENAELSEDAINNITSDIVDGMFGEPVEETTQTEESVK